MALTEWRPSRPFVRRVAIALAILTIGAPLLVGIAAWIVAGVIVILNVKLLVDTFAG